MVDRVAPAGNSSISVSFATLFDGSLDAASAVAQFPAARLEPAVTGWMHPNHTLTSQAGTERVEDGSTITDHIVAMPARLSLQGHVSDITSPRGADGPADVWNTLRLLHKAETMVHVVTDWGSYKNMMIRNIDTTQTHRGMVFTLDLQEVVRVGVAYFEPSNRKDTGKDRSGHVYGGQNDLYSIEDPTTGAVLLDADGQPVAELDGVMALLPDGKTQAYASRDKTYMRDGKLWISPSSLTRADYENFGLPVPDHL